MSQRLTFDCSISITGGTKKHKKVVNLRPEVKAHRTTVSRGTID
jgi:hypothetical protein